MKRYSKDAMFLLLCMCASLTASVGAQTLPSIIHEPDNKSESPTYDIVLRTVLQDTTFMHESIGIRFYWKYGGYARASREFETLTNKRAIGWGDGASTSLVGGRGIHLAPNLDSTNPPAIVVTEKNSVVPKFVIYYKSQVMTRFRANPSNIRS